MRVLALIYFAVLVASLNSQEVLYDSDDSDCSEFGINHAVSFFKGKHYSRTIIG
jgi:hypothetical protein